MRAPGNDESRSIVCLVTRRMVLSFSAAGVRKFQKLVHVKGRNQTHECTVGSERQATPPSMSGCSRRTARG